MASYINRVGNFFARMKNMAAVDSDDESTDLVRTRELISNLRKSVIAEERWKLSSETQDDEVADQMAERQGVVVTLEDDQTRYLVRRIPNKQVDGVVDVIVTYASSMDQNWVRVGDKDKVENAKLEDYLDQCEDPKDKTKDNLGESEDKTESTDVKLVKSEDKKDSTGGHSNQFENKMDSTDGSKDSEDTMK